MIYNDNIRRHPMYGLDLPVKLSILAYLKPIPRFKLMNNLINGRAIDICNL